MIRLWEFWRDRFQIEVSHNFHGDPEVGNNILIRNLSSKPVILTYWELRWMSGRWPFRSVTRRLDLGPDITDCRIDARSSKTLHFRGPDHFDWGVHSLRGNRIYIQLDFAGRRSLLRKVYG